MQTNTTIHLETAYLSPGILRVDVMALNVPADLFGVAFHMRIRGGEWSLENFQKGAVFGDGSNSPLVLAEERQVSSGFKEIVFGMTLKRTESATAKDGKLVSFNLKIGSGAKISIDLSDVRLVALGESVTEIPNVKWEEATVDIGALAAGQAMGRAMARTESVTMREAQGVVNPDFAKSLKSDLLSAPAFWDVYLVMAVFAGVSLLFFLIYLFTRRMFRRTRE